MPTTDSPDRLGDLAASWHNLKTVAEITTAMARQSADVLGEGAVSVMLNQQHQLSSEAASDPGLLQADLLQIVLQEGPAFDIARDATAVYCPDLTVADEWPRWGPATAVHGWRSWFSMQMLDAGQNVLGVLSYAHRLPEAVTPDLTDQLLELSIHGAAALASARTRENQTSARRP